MDLIIKGGVLIMHDGPRRTDLGIADGRIAAIGPDLQGAQQLDAGGRYVLPGAIDAHVHFDAPVGMSRSSDDFYTGTVAAACGGTTTVIDFMETGRGVTLPEAFRRRRALADPQVAVDYGLHMVFPNDEPRRLADIPELVAQGCTSCKLFLAYEGLWLDDAQFIQVLTALKTHAALPMVHAESHHAIQHLCKTFLAQGKTSPRYHALSRPAFMEGEATMRAVALARLVGLPIYIAHVSCEEALTAIRQAQDAGFPAYGETCPHYLLLTAAEYERPGSGGARFIMSPPLRGERDQAALWAGLAQGQLQVASTDHCAFFVHGQKVPADPEAALPPFTEIPNGVPGVEARLSLLFTFGVRTGRLSLSRWVDVCCSEPARLFGLAPQKGELTVGADADIVIFDPERSLTLTHGILHENTDYTPFEGMRLQGYPEITLLRGQVVARDGQFLGEAGQGRYLRRGRSSALSMA